MLLTKGSEIAAPVFLAYGEAFDDPENSWPYLIMSRIPGQSVNVRRLTAAQRLTLATDLGIEIKKIHDLPPDGILTADDWPIPDIQEAVAK
jgi:hygromycin-B 7''-O-kinase